jgi:hypothetical protein
MSDADRIFSLLTGQAARTASNERRFINAPRRKGSVSTGPRVVEVVQVRQRGAKPNEAHGPAKQPRTHAQTWPDGFRAKPPLPLPSADQDPAEPEPVQPGVHVMPMWQPSPQPSEVAEANPPKAPVEAAAPRPRRRRDPAPAVPQQGIRRFADPFSDEGGANCMRCGYLVEPAREGRGLLTCAACG